MTILVGPVPVKERVVVIDVIRGFALFGVLLVNMVMFNYTMLDFGFGRDALLRPDLLVNLSDRIVAWFVQVVFQGKFYTIFAFLFGLGFYLFLHRSNDNQAVNSRLFRRRIFILLLVGLLHLVFVWWGDVLTVYAFIGFVLLVFQETKLSRLRNWIIGLLTFSVVLISASLLLAVAMSAIALDAPDPGRDIYLYGSYWDVVQYRLAVETPAVLVNTIFMVPRILGLFLLGLYAGRSGIFKNSDAHLPFIRKAWRIGGLVGVGLSLLHLGLQLNLISLTATPMINIMSAVVLREISTPFLSLFYVSSIMLLWHAHKLRRLSSGLAALGRMALTNYLVQCLVCSILFYGYGIGLMGSISMPSILLLTLAIYGIQVIYSTWWLNRYTHGPAEWVWRRLTYGRVLSADNTPTAYIK